MKPFTNLEIIIGIISIIVFIGLLYYRVKEIKKEGY
jgi:FtsH-binding integral membrane protein